MTAVPELEALPPVNLTDLVGVADLQARVDRKYVVPDTTLPALLQALNGSASALQIDGRREFAYRSVYLDTPDLRSFHGAGHRRRRRFKVRGREYVDSGESWLEVKTRVSRGMTLKSRIPHDDLRTSPLTGAGHDFVRGALRDAGIPAPGRDALAPALVTTYHRSTLLLPASAGRPHARATIDTRLGFLAPGDQRPRLVLDGLAVVETKGGHGPCPLDRLLWRMGHRPVVMSKYGAGLRAVREDLPDLKWHRTLRRHLRPALHPDLKEAS